jgi:ATP-dependent helicase/nuclease subunit B
MMFTMITQIGITDLSTIVSVCTNTWACMMLGWLAEHILDAEEESRIRELIAAGTWPHGWDGDEPRADELLETLNTLRALRGGRQVRLKGKRLQALSGERFAQAMERNFLDRAWLVRWMASIPAYVEWQLGREAAGWSVRESEADRVRSVETPSGRMIQLRGRLDRIDGRPDGAGGWLLSVVDYKAQSKDVLRKRAEDPAEHVQLPSYVLLADGTAVETLFLSIHGDSVTALPSPGDPQLAARSNLERLARLADRIHDGTPMPANGIEAACSHCDMRGLCRRDHWSAPDEGTGR